MTRRMRKKKQVERKVSLVRRGKKIKRWKEKQDREEGEGSLEGQ